MNRPTIAVLAMGGTIVSSGSTAAQMTGYSLQGVKVDDILAGVPEVEDIADLQVQTVRNLSSCSIVLDDWLSLAQAVEAAALRDDVAGVVITHGTDTLEETAFFLNLISKTEKPVVLTGAMRPSTAISADGPLNLLNAVRVAASSKACGKGVLIVLNGAINGARDTTKTHTLAPETFTGRDFGRMGYVVGDEVEFFMQSTRPHTVKSEFSLADFVNSGSLPRVDIIYAHIGEDSAMLNASLASGAKGIVFAGTGHGSIPVQIEDQLFEASRSGVVVVRASRIGAGPVLNGKKKWQNAGIIPCGMLNAQKARILLQLALKKFGGDLKEIERVFRTY